MPFMVKSTAVGNLSGEEDFFYENGTWKQAKMEEVNPSDLSDYEADNPENQDNQENQGTPDREEPNNDHELSENQNENEQNMDLDEPHPNTGNCQAQEVAQNTGVSSEFLTRCESGRIVEATWNGKPPTTKEYEEDQRQMKTLRNGHSCLLMDPTKFCPFFTTSCLLMDPKTSCLLMDPNQDFPLSKSHVF